MEVKYLSEFISTGGETSERERERERGGTQVGRKITTVIEKERFVEINKDI